VEVAQESQNIAYDIAVRSGVLLKNYGALPLDKAQSLAVIGPSGHQLTHGAGFAERAWGFADRKTSPLQALRNAAPNLSITSAIGVDIHGSVITSSALQTVDGQPGLRRNDSVSTTITTDSAIDFSGATVLSGDRSYTWIGKLIAPETGWYRVNLQRHYPSPASHVLNDTDFRTLSAVDSITVDGTKTSGYRLLLDGGLRQWSSPIETEDGWDETATDMYLEAGPTNLTVNVPSIFGDPISVRLSWVTPSQRSANIAAAVAAASEVDVPVVFAHAASPAETALQLVQGHDELIAQVAVANPNTVVVLFNAEPVLMPWLDAVAAVLWMGHPGQEGGRATADLLLGRRSPQGRLPVTYPVSRNATVTRDPAYPERWDANNATAVFSDGLNTGYRWYLYANTSTLFPFGHGLSYTSFEYGDLAVSNVSESSFDVSFMLRNTGSVAGAEVPQLYIGPPEGATSNYPGIQFAYSALADFDSVELEVAGVRRVQFSIMTRQLSFWNQTDRSWVLTHGTRQIWVGRNAEQKELMGTISV
jgi:beta-glucosidase